MSRNSGEIVGILQVLLYTSSKCFGDLEKRHLCLGVVICVLLPNEKAKGLANATLRSTE